MGQEKIRVKEAILVEGRDDKQRLETVVDGLVLETDGAAGGDYYPHRQRPGGLPNQGAY